MPSPREVARARLGARLDAARDRGFVGRDAALDLFRQALEADVAPFAAYFVHGPGGVGKTTLLRRLLREAQAAGAMVREVDAHQTPASSAAVLRALGVDSLEALADALASAPRAVVAIDTYELLAPLDAWVRDELAPALPEHTTLLLAGRDPPSTPWRADPGWSALLATVALGNLSPEESGRLLAARAVPEAMHGAVHALTYGHPLALALVADLWREGDHDLPGLTPDVVRTLLAALLRAVPSPRHREALELAALARLVDRPLLRDLAGDEDGALHEWLLSLSFLDRTRAGLHMHDVVRDALLADAQARDVEAAERRRKAFGARVAERLLSTSDPRVRTEAALDVVHLYRTNPGMRQYYAWVDRIGGGSRPMRPDELEAPLSVIREHEGPEAARLAEGYHARYPGSFVTLESANGASIGWLVYLRLDAEALALEAATDPVIAAARDAIAATGPLRPSEHTGLLRFWPWKDGYQELGSPAHAPHSTHLILEWCSAPGLGPAIVVLQRDETWAPFLKGIDFLRVPQHGRATLEGRDYHLFAHDFRTIPPTAWMAGQRSTAETPREVLTRDRFDGLVREALKSCARPEALSDSPLLASRAVLAWAEGDPVQPAMLRELLEVAASSVGDERDDRARRAVELTYLRPAPTQEIAAERLGMSFSTFRRQLARGVEGVIDYLWARELGT
ncbi:MAG: AAA family ATPase [Sandaracinaceae bacterium]|nr:AAA family ATPase [Sandaracinaceae bacterium]